MGAGQSSTSLPRLRKFLVIKAYNCRPRNMTLREQFTSLRMDGAGSRGVIRISALKKELSIKADWVDEMLQEVLQGADTVDFEVFMQFLENGSIMVPPPAPVGMTPVASKVEPLNGAAGGGRGGSGNGSGIAHRSRDKKRRLLRFATTQDPNAAIYPEVMAALEYKLEPVSALVVHKGLTVSQPKYRPVPLHPGKPLWRKREVVRQERIVQYTTVDSQGVVQELLETERTETEVVHMECRETGEFAHRESTEYEQTETFNNEVVAHERGNEEYVHLKSLDDEYEFLDSNMPNRRAPVSPQAESPPSPINAGPEAEHPGDLPPEYLFAAASPGAHGAEGDERLRAGIPPEYLYPTTDDQEEEEGETADGEADGGDVDPSDMRYYVDGVLLDDPDYDGMV